MNQQKYQVTWLIRRLFRAMGERANNYLRDLGISAADRAVLEFLHTDAPLSVPEIAVRYDVSRQHVQVTVNRLLDKGLVATRENPRHRRSPHIELTKAGRTLFRNVRAAEKEEIEALFTGVSSKHLESTHHVLTTMLERLKEGEET